MKSNFKHDSGKAVYFLEAIRKLYVKLFYVNQILSFTMLSCQTFVFNVKILPCAMDAMFAFKGNPIHDELESGSTDA